MGDRGFSMKQAAESIGCNQSLISHILRGARGVGLEVAVKIEAATQDWENGPIKAAEWVGHHPTVTTVDPLRECA